jgi:Uma2 family endonuclease
MGLVVEPQAHRWTHSEYYKMSEVGLFDGQHVELIEGEVIEMSPMGSYHRTSVLLTVEALRRVFGQGYFVSTQCPLDLGEISEPELDVAVVVGEICDYKEVHPTTAVLIVEVVDTSLRDDRTTKASLYAKAGIRDYWVLNLIHRRLEVRRKPVANETQPFGFGYAEVTILTETDVVTPLAAGQAVIAVADLLP